MSEDIIKTCFNIIPYIYNNITERIFIKNVPSLQDALKLWESCNDNIYIFLQKLNKEQQNQYLNFVNKNLKLPEEQVYNIIKKSCYILELINKKINIDMFEKDNNGIGEFFRRNKNNTSILISRIDSQTKEKILNWCIKNINIEDIFTLYQNGRPPVFFTNNVIEVKKPSQTTSICGYRINNLGKPKKVDESSILPKGVRTYQQLTDILG
jgi:hypothetical protein